MTATIDGDDGARKDGERMSTKRLERAKQLGYLVRLSGSSMTLANAYFEWCASRGLPCVRVDMRTRYASIEVDWIGVHQGWQGPRETDGWPTMPSEEMCDAAARCFHKYALAKGFNWHRDAFG